MVFCKNSVLKIFCEIHWKTLAWESPIVVIIIIIIITIVIIIIMSLYSFRTGSF